VKKTAADNRPWKALEQGLSAVDPFIILVSGTGMPSYAMYGSFAAADFSSFIDGRWNLKNSTKKRVHIMVHMLKKSYICEKENYGICK